MKIAPTAFLRGASGLLGEDKPVVWNVLGLSSRLEPESGGKSSMFMLKESDRVDKDYSDGARDFCD